MAFSKKTYVSGQTAITADNLNAIQDELIRVGGAGTVPVVDYVVAQGISGNWTYRKWNSGIAECWAKITQTVTPGDVWAGTLNLAPYVITVTTPIEFTGIDCVNASAYVGSGHTITSSVSDTPPNKISIPALSVYLTGQQECKAYVYVMGRWK